MPPAISSLTRFVDNLTLVFKPNDTLLLNPSNNSTQLFEINLSSLNSAFEKQV